MKRLTTRLLLVLGGGYLVVSGYQGIQNASGIVSRLAPGAYFLAGVLFVAGALRKPRAPAVAPDPNATRVSLNRAEKITFRTMGAIATLVGVGWLGICSWMTWQQWIKVAQWPRINAVLVSKDISPVGATLVFQYEVRGRHVTGSGIHYAPRETVRRALESYQPGAIQKISYNPENVTDLEWNLSYNWEFFRIPVGGMMFCWVFIAGGVQSYRSSYGWEADDDSSGGPNESQRMEQQCPGQSDAPTR